MDNHHAERHRIAVIGGGPRGLAALENLYAMLARQALSRDVECTLFEASTYPGSGPNYAPDQFAGSLLNVPERALDLPQREDFLLDKHVITGFPSYKAWAGVNDGADNASIMDHYPQRARLGQYLQERFSSIAAVLETLGLLHVIESEVLRIEQGEIDGSYTIVHATGVVKRVTEVVLTIGHQPTVPDDTLQAWKQFADAHTGCRLIADAYPLENYIHDKAIDSGSTVALRGFGLSMIDVVKGLTEGRGGAFTVTDTARRHMNYVRSGNEPASIVPFSLDGLPMAAKPLSKRLDEQFEPSSQLREDFEQQCQVLSEKSGATDAFRQLIVIVSGIQAEVFLMTNPIASAEYTKTQLSELAIEWLYDEHFKHELVVDRDLPTEEAMRRFVEMACGKEAPSFDYCLGQVWRHLQKTLFHSFSHSGLARESMRDLISLHERMKRYAYGPPVDNIQRLLALLDAGLLSLMIIDDPDIEISPEGWHFVSDEGQKVASVLIDTVLSSPAVCAVSTPLVRQLLADGYLTPIHESLGVVTSRCAVAEPSCENPVHTPVALLGRLAKGSILGADSVVESFGREAQDWAAGLLGRLQDA